MKALIATILTLVMLAAIACGGEEQEPAPNIPATVEAGIRGTAEAESAVRETVEAGVMATVEAEAAIESTVEARVAREVERLSPTATPTPTPVPPLTATPEPTQTPTPIPPPTATTTAEATQTPAPIAPPTATSTPDPTAVAASPETPEPTAAASTPLPPEEAPATLEEYADRHAGGPRAIYVGDLAQLAGPAVSDEYLQEHGRVLGDDFGHVPLRAIAEHRWIFESDYYQSLLEKARLTEPTVLLSEGESINPPVLLR